MAGSFTFATLQDKSANGVTQANGINNAGQIVGFYNDGSGVGHGFLDSSGTFTPIDDPSAAGTPPLCPHGGGAQPLPCPLTEALGINAAGQIVGSYIDGAGGHHGFLYSGGIFTTIDDPLGTGIAGASLHTVLDGINNLGQIVGFHVSGSGIGAFLYDRGVYTAIDDPSSVMTNGGGTSPGGINDLDQIAGEFTPSPGQDDGFLTAPTPEPSTLALALAAFLVMALVRRMRLSRP